MSEFQNLTERQLFQINKLKSAIPGRYYYSVDGRVFVGTSGHILKERVLGETVVYKEGYKPSGGTPVFEKPFLEETEKFASTRTKTVEVDFGSELHSQYKVFNIDDSDVFEGDCIVAQIAYSAPTGKSLDEIEMDDFSVKAGTGVQGGFKLIVAGLTGPLRNKFKVNYTISWP